MVKLPGGFSPWQAVQQIADDANPFDGGSRDRDIFSDKYNQRNGQPVAQPGGNMTTWGTGVGGGTGTQNSGYSGGGGGSSRFSKN